MPAMMILLCGMLVDIRTTKCETLVPPFVPFCISQIEQPKGNTDPM